MCGALIQACQTAGEQGCTSICNVSTEAPTLLTPDSPLVDSLTPVDVTEPAGPLPTSVTDLPDIYEFPFVTPLPAVDPCSDCLWGLLDTNNPVDPQALLLITIAPTLVGADLQDAYV
ncbi:MAG: hypothetical protein ACI9WU_005336, partial [Myxococcota bacterium]